MKERFLLEYLVLPKIITSNYLPDNYDIQCCKILSFVLTALIEVICRVSVKHYSSCYRVFYFVGYSISCPFTPTDLCGYRTGMSSVVPWEIKTTYMYNEDVILNAPDGKFCVV